MKKNSVILCVTNDLNTDQRMIRICSSLASHGFEVQLVGVEKKESAPLSQQSYKQTRIRSLFHKGPLFYLEYNIRLFFFLLFSKFDIVCANDVDTLLACSLVKKIKLKKGVYDSHEYFIETPEIQHRRIVKYIWTKIEKNCAPLMDAHYTVASMLSTVLSQNLGIQFEVIRNLPQDRHFVSSLSNKSEKILLYQGFINVGRGLEETVEALDSLPDYELWIAGKGQILFQLEKSVKPHLKNRIKFLGELTPHELRQITPRARYGLNLLRGESLNYYYSLANKFFDYLQAGVPSINVSLPEYQKIIHEYSVGFLIEKCSSYDLVNLIRTIDSNPEKYQDVLYNIERNKHRFIWKYEEAKLVEIYTGLSKNKKSSSNV